MDIIFEALLEILLEIVVGVAEGGVEVIVSRAKKKRLERNQKKDFRKN